MAKKLTPEILEKFDIFMEHANPQTPQAAEACLASFAKHKGVDPEELREAWVTFNMMVGLVTADPMLAALLDDFIVNPGAAHAGGGFPAPFDSLTVN